MNLITPIEAADVGLSAIMRRESIYQVRHYQVGRFSVTLQDGRRGVGLTVGEALEKAKAS